MGDAYGTDDDDRNPLLATAILHLSDVCTALFPLALRYFIAVSTPVAGGWRRDVLWIRVGHGCRRPTGGERHSPYLTQIKLLCEALVIVTPFFSLAHIS